MLIRKFATLPRMILIVFALLSLLLGLVWFVFLSGRDRNVLFATELTFTHEGRERRYLIARPKSVNESSKIIVGLHGFGDFPRRFAYYTALHNAANEHDIVLYPRASEPMGDQQRIGWNAGFCCGSGWLNQVNDSDFIVSLVRHIASESGIEENKPFYITGFSNGAFMAQRVAADYPEMVAAVGAASGTIGTDKKRLEPKGPVAVLLMHGKNDRVVPFEGGAGATDPDFNWLSHAQTLEAWQQVNGSDAQTKEIVYDNDGHKWHDWRIFNIWNKTPVASKEVVNFFNSI